MLGRVTLLKFKRRLYILPVLGCRPHAPGGEGQEIKEDPEISCSAGVLTGRVVRRGNSHLMQRPAAGGANRHIGIGQTLLQDRSMLGIAAAEFG